MNLLPIVMTLFRRNRATVLLFVCLVTIAVALGIAVPAQERALRQGSARAADRFDLIVGAPGSQTELLMNIVYLQPSAIELLKPEVLARAQDRFCRAHRLRRFGRRFFRRRDDG